MTKRHLNLSEIGIAREVFVDTLPYDNIYISDALGFKNLEYTLCYPNLDDPALSTYKIHAGPGGYAGMERNAYERGTLIHELTHVWQGEYGIWPATYVFSSLFAQAAKGQAAYRYEPGQPWEHYNAEQQASIVEDWFDKGKLKDGPLYPYVRDKIRNPKRRN